MGDRIYSVVNKSRVQKAKLTQDFCSRQSVQYSGVSHNKSGIKVFCEGFWYVNHKMKFFVPFLSVVTLLTVVVVILRGQGQM